MVTKILIIIFVFKIKVSKITRRRWRRNKVDWTLANINVPINVWNTLSTDCVHATIVLTRGDSCQHGFMFGCKQWSTDINQSN